MGLAMVLDKRTSYYSSYYSGNCNRQCPSGQYVDNRCRCAYNWSAWQNQGKWIFAGCLGGGILALILIGLFFRYKERRLFKKPLYNTTIETPWKKRPSKPWMRKSKTEPTPVAGTHVGGYNTGAAQDSAAGALTIPTAYGQPKLG